MNSNSNSQNKEIFSTQQKDQLITKLITSMRDLELKKVNLNKNINEYETSNAQLQRKIEQIKSDTQKIAFLRAKNSDLFSKYAHKRLTLAKKIVEAERESENLDDEIMMMKIQGEKVEEVNKVVDMPNADKLYLELMEGLGFYVQQRNTKYCIMGVSKDKKTIKYDDNKLAAEELWKFVE